MKKVIYTLLIYITTFLPCFSQHVHNIIPAPVDITTGTNVSTIGLNLKWNSNLSTEQLNFYKDYFNEMLLLQGIKHKRGKIKTINAFVDSLYKKDNPDFYSVSFDDDKNIKIKSNSNKGIFYALQTISQLVCSDDGKICIASVNDYPRLPYRGLMIDCSRHFWDKTFILRQIDLMSKYKFTHLNLHLTDAGGWRIESKKYPVLTEKAAFRTVSDWNDWWVNGTDRKYANQPTDYPENAYNFPHSQPYGGYYTQDELRDIVDYAAKRHIVIVPEIEMPGHSEEVLAALPYLQCQNTKTPSGAFCVGNEETFDFLENVLDEIMDVFPSEYIHIGGDECSREQWEKCDKCQQRMAEEGLNSSVELQSYLTERIERYINLHGRKLLGWDEILEGYLAPNAVVMSWRGTEGGLKAANMGHDVVMTPGGYCYLDAYQDAPAMEPRAFGGYTPLEKTYGFEPVPDEIRGTNKEKHIIGVQGNLWTEMMETPSHAEYMIWPRALAIAEIGWSQAHDDYADFRRRASAATEQMKTQGYNPFLLSQERGQREESKHTISHEAIGKKVVYAAPYADVYKAAGDNSLVDGLSGNWSYGDGRWQGFITKKGFELTIDMENITEINDISINFMQFSGPEIFAPAHVEMLISSDGNNFTTIYERNYPVSRDNDYFIRNETWVGNTNARYIKVKASAGKYGGWIFTDEVFVNTKNDERED